MLGNCPDCGKNMDMVGRVHNCVAPSIIEVVPVAADGDELSPPMTNSQRQAKWRKAHPEEHRERMRDYMRKRRG